MVGQKLERWVKSWDGWSVTGTVRYEMVIGGVYLAVFHTCSYDSLLHMKELKAVAGLYATRTLCLTRALLC